MKRHLFSAVASAVLLAAFVPAQATDVARTFDVKVALAAICTVSAAVPVLDFGTYTAFAATHTAAPTANLTLTCTRGLTAPTFGFDAALGGADGVIAGLNYSLTAANGAVVGGTVATPGVVGTADVRTVTISGSMAGNQPGACANTAAGCSAAITQTRTLTVTY